MAKKSSTRTKRNNQTTRTGMGTGILDKLRELDQQRSAIMDGAKNEALAAAKAAIAALNNLGFNYSLASSRAGGKEGSRKGTRTVRDVPCPICNFKTNPPHDRRAHRSQGASKKPFTAAELESKGLMKA